MSNAKSQTDYLKEHEAKVLSKRQGMPKVNEVLKFIEDLIIGHSVTETEKENLKGIYNKFIFIIPQMDASQPIFYPALASDEEQKKFKRVIKKLRNFKDSFGNSDIIKQQDYLLARIYFWILRLQVKQQTSSPILDDLLQIIEAHAINRKNENERTLQDKLCKYQNPDYKLYLKHYRNLKNSLLENLKLFLDASSDTKIDLKKLDATIQKFFRDGSAQNLESFFSWLRSHTELNLKNSSSLRQYETAYFNTLFESLKNLNEIDTNIRDKGQVIPVNFRLNQLSDLSIEVGANAIKFQNQVNSDPQNTDLKFDPLYEKAAKSFQKTALEFNKIVYKPDKKRPFTLFAKTSGDIRKSLAGILLEYRNKSDRIAWGLHRLLSISTENLQTVDKLIENLNTQNVARGDIESSLEKFKNAAQEREDSRSKYAKWLFGSSRLLRVATELQITCNAYYARVNLSQNSDDETATPASMIR